MPYGIDVHEVLEKREAWKLSISSAEAQEWSFVEHLISIGRRSGSLPLDSMPALTYVYGATIAIGGIFTYQAK